ncbi:hypothetical protein GCM10022408_21230 [Hymenobacter fastidiosus]|uniref:Uncharacterized protein n=2 Tax=Hymenobacter fastidiosus TaxID=486264 RepID=A0ABP7SAK4_9BACT
MSRILFQGPLIAALFSFAPALGQVQATPSPSILGSIAASYAAKEFSKEVAVYRAKEFVMREILGPSSEVVKFDIDPLAASSSGELTSLVYQSATKSKEGLILGFFGDRWNAQGVVYQGYAFKSIPKEKALEMLAFIDKQLADNSTYFIVGGESANIYFQYDDMIFLINKTSGGIKTRVFWQDFDAEWEDVAYQRTKKRLMKKLN